MIILRQKEFGLIGKMKQWAKDYNASKGFGEPDLEKERINRQLQRENERKTQHDNFASLSPSHKEALRIYKESEKGYPGIGDGDEYASFTIDPSSRTIYLNPNRSRYEFKNNGWYDVDSGKKVNIKKDLISEIDSDINSYSKDEYGWGKEDSDKVVEYLKKQRKLIETSKL